MPNTLFAATCLGASKRGQVLPKSGLPQARFSDPDHGARMIISKPMSGLPYDHGSGPHPNSCHLEKCALKILGWPCFLVYFHCPCRYPAWRYARLTLEACCPNEHVNLRLPARDKEKEILIWASLGTCPHSVFSQPLSCI